MCKPPTGCEFTLLNAHWIGVTAANGTATNGSATNGTATNGLPPAQETQLGVRSAGAMVLPSLMPTTK
jgi:hypothetical protein